MTVVQSIHDNATMNTFLKRRGKLFIIPASPGESDETEPLAFEFSLHRKKNARKFLALRNSRIEDRTAVKSRNEVIAKNEVGQMSINDPNSSNDIVGVFCSQPQKRQIEKSNPNRKLDFSLSFNTDDLISADTANITTANFSSLISDMCEEIHHSDSNKSKAKEKSADDSSETFCIKRKLFITRSSNKTFQNTSPPECDMKICSNVENAPHIYKSGSFRKKSSSCNYATKVIELRKQFHTLAKQLKYSETDEEKCYIIVKIVFHYLKGPFNHLCDRILPKIILMIEEMCRNEDSKLICSIVLYALMKTELISKLSDVLALTISLMKATTLLPPEKQENSNEIKIEKHLDLLKFIGKNENREIIKYYTAPDFAVDSILKFTTYSKTDAYKTELRHMRGLDAILDIVNSQTTTIWNEQLSPEIQLYNVIRLEHSLNVLQNVIFNSPENQCYILEYRSFQLLQNISSVLRFIQQKFLLEKSDTIPTCEYIKCLSSTLKLLINISHKNVQGSIHIETHGEIIGILLFFLPRLKQADITLLCLGLLANLVMTSKDNLHKFTALKVKCLGFQDKVNSVVALSEMFQNMHLEVQKLETVTEKLLLATAVKNSSTVEDFEDDTSAVFHSAGDHMEHSMMCSFLALILGYAIEDNKEHALAIKRACPNIRFDDMADVLKEFYDFAVLTDLLEGVHLQEIQSIVDFLYSL